ncbi:OmpA family protein [Thiocystis violacea]|uniref:OmpA family protein n=1 Tax=Thiocystis violacea TaxID=13725 RepID=UPI001F5BACB4|nr:OmpA family protein [Thiocystis violacea]
MTHAPLPPFILLLLAALLPRIGHAEQTTYVSKDASRCEIFQALSARIPDDCLVDKTPVIHSTITPVPSPEPAAQLASVQPPRSEAHRPAPRPAKPRQSLSRQRPSGERAMATPIEFAFDSDRLTPAARSHLDRIAAVLKDPLFNGLAIRIEGHTDARGTTEYNLDLSRRRARSVQDYLAAKHAIDVNHIPSIGRGEEDLFDPRRPEAGINRRVEFVNTGLVP